MTPLPAPFPYFGGKRRAAARIWDALGDVGGYVEPFAGSAAVLLARPDIRGRRIETLNDSDGWLINAWRAIQLDPLGVAAAASGPVNEADYHARLAWLQDRRTPELVAWLEGHPEHHDAKAAGWWLYVMACAIGSPFDGGPWHVEDGFLKREGGPGTPGAGIARALPALGTNRGVLRVDYRDGLGGYLTQLADRLREVRLACGDWKRVLTPSAMQATAGPNVVGVLLDPPYATSGDLYAATAQGGADVGADIGEEVRAWCQANARAGLRIVLCGFEDEHDALLEQGWSKDAGRAGGSGMTVDVHAGKRERLWLSPACLDDALFSFEEARA